MAMNNNMQCGNNCAPTQLVLYDGTCGYCDPYFAISPDHHECIQPLCDGRSILEITGVCRRCLDFTRPHTDGK